MLPLPARMILVVDGIDDDPLTAARAERLRAGIPAKEERRVDDAELARIVGEELKRPRHGMARDIEPIVVFNRFRFDEPESEAQRRREAYPPLAKRNLDGHGGFYWRNSGAPEWREKTGLVCQPAWQLHTIVGCHFRCAYCSLGYIVNIFLNMEEYVERLDEEIRRCPDQTLFQWDNNTDSVCFEPELGATKLLVDYFARQEGKSLELYVGKSDHVDFLLDYDHRGHTVCCWSLSAPTQAELFEHRSASTQERIESMRKCRDAGYPVRVRFSPLIPTTDWRRENRETIRALFSKVRPDVITIETIRFLKLPDMERYFDMARLDPAMLEAMRTEEGKELTGPGCEVPDAFREDVYRFMIDEIREVSPDTRVCFCRELRSVWDDFAGDLAPRGQTPDQYICNCGPFSHPETVGAWK